MALRNIRLEQDEDSLVRHQLYLDDVNVSQYCYRMKFEVDAASVPHIEVFLNGNLTFSGKANADFNADKILLLMDKTDMEKLYNRWCELHTESISSIIKGKHGIEEENGK